MDDTALDSQADKLATLLDSKFSIPGTNFRFGLDPIIGLLPGAGDWVTGMVSTYFILLGVRADVPKAVLGRMGFNIILDVFIGSIPLFGDIFDFGWKANQKNAGLLKKHRRDAAKTERRSRWMLWLTAAVLIILVVALLVLITWLIAEIIQAVF